MIRVLSARSPLSPESSNPNPDPVDQSTSNPRTKKRRDPKLKSHYPTDKFLSIITEELYRAYDSFTWVSTRFIRFLDFSLASYPLSELLEASGLRDIWSLDNCSPYCRDSVKQFHCNKKLLTRDDEKVLTSYVNGEKFEVTTSVLHSVLNIPSAGMILSHIEMKDAEVLKRMCLTPPPILISSIKKNKMTKIAKNPFHYHILESYS